MQTKKKGETHTRRIVIFAFVSSDESKESVHTHQKHEVYYYRYQDLAVHYNNTHMGRQPILWILLVLTWSTECRVIGKQSPVAEIFIIFVTFAAVSLLGVAIAIYLKDNDCIARTNRMIIRHFQKNLLNQESELTEDTVTQGNNPLSILNNESFETNNEQITVGQFKTVTKTLKKSTRMDISIIEEATT